MPLGDGGCGAGVTAVGGGGVSAWDEVDRLRKEAEEKYRRENANWLPRPDKTLSRDKALTQRAEIRIRNGFHPLGLRLLEGPTAETCGTCAHLETRKYAGTYFKCALRGGGASASTDVRKKWPACVSWKAKESKP